MSGQQIGAVVGGAIGAYFGGPAGAQFGAAIGGAIGGAIDPEKIKAPSIGDAQKQTAQAGVPRPVVYGHPAPFAGNIIDGETKARKIKVKESQGKGGGPVVISERFLMTYAIRICEGPIAGIVRIWRNGEVVYDRRTAAQITAIYGTSAPAFTAEQRAKTAAFSSKVRIYLGGEDQLPDAALEAIHGVGNTPYYRGTAYIVIEDDDVTDTRGAAAQYQFEVVSVGTEVAAGDDAGLAAGRMAAFADAEWPLPEAEANYSYTGTIGLVTPGGGTAEYSAGTIQEVIDYFTNPDYSTIDPLASGSRAPTHYLGYAAKTGDGTTPGIGIDLIGWSVIDPQSVVDSTSLYLVYNDFPADVMAPSGTFTCGVSGVQQGSRGEIVKPLSSDPGGQWEMFNSCGGVNSLYGLWPLCIKATARRVAPLSVPSGALEIPDAPGHYVAADGSTGLMQTYTVATGTYKVLGLSTTVTIDSRQQFDFYEVGPVLASTHADYSNQTFWDAEYAAAVSAGTLPAGYTYSPSGGSGAVYPRSSSSVFQGSDGTTLATISGDAITLRSVVEDIAERCNVPAANIDATALTDIIPGYLVANQFTGADSLRPTQQIYHYDMPEVDGKIVAVKRGGAIAATVADDDLLQGSDEQEMTRPQQVEFPAKVTVITQDPAADYSPVPQTSIRSSINVTSTSEVVVQSPIPLSGTEAAQRASIAHKVLFAQAEGRRTFLLPEEFSRLVPSDAISHNGIRWLIESKKSTEGENEFECVYDRASAYTSSATGSTITPPAIPTTGLKGPTVFVAMNLPRLRTQDGTPGMHVAAHGVMDGWEGAQLYLSVDGGVTEQPVLRMASAATMGTLTAAITESGTPLAVSVYGLLESVTAAQIANRANAFAIVTGSTAEIGQFQTATLTADTATADSYDLTDLTRELLGTEPAAHSVGDRFVLLDSDVYFLPIDIGHAGKTLIFRAVTLGTIPENNATFSIVYDPRSLTSPVIEFYTDSSGSRYTDATGAYYFKES